MATTTPTLWAAPFLVNTTDAGGGGDDQHESQIVALADGYFMVVWLDDSDTVVPGLGAPDIRGQFLDFDGALDGPELDLNSFVDFAQAHPRIAATADGGFVLVYQTTADPLFSQGENVVFEATDVCGCPAHAPDWIDSTANETAPAVTTFADTSYVVVFEDDAAGDKDVRAMVVIPDGLGGTVLGPEFSIAEGAGDQTAPDAVTLADGSFVTVYETDNGGQREIAYSIRDQLGAAILGGTVGDAADDEFDPQVAALKGGGFVAVWTAAAGDGDGSAVMARVYDAAGAPLGAAFPVETTTAGDQDQPAVTQLADGGFLAAWRNVGTGEIFGQRFNAAGAAVGTEFVMASMTAASEPDLALLGDGRVALSFTDTAAGNADIYAAIWDPRSNPISGTAEADLVASRLEGASVFGLDGDDVLLGVDGNDKLYGGNGTDILDGGGGVDTLDGGAGDDVMSGGAGNDGMRGSTGFDLYDGGDGIDAVNYALSSGVNVYLDGSRLNSRAAAGDDFFDIENIVGSTTGRDTLVGDKSANRLYGNGGDDFLAGGDGNDQLEGGAGNDLLIGGAGNDALVGGDGADLFAFLDLPPFEGLDRTSDFLAGTDKIQVSASAFGGGLTAGGAVQLVANANPTSAGLLGGVFLYDTDSGFLSWDGNGQETGAGVAFLRLQNLPGLTAADFVVVA